MKLKITSHSPEETIQCGKQLVRAILPEIAQKAVIFAVEGEMGAGKTQLAKGMALGLGIEKIISSPTYVLVKEYVSPSGVKFVHMDGWRLEKATPEEVGLDQYICPSTLILIEWPAIFINYLKGLSDAIVYTVSMTDQGNDIRDIEMQAL